MDNSPGITKALAEKLDKGSVDGAELAKVLAELRARHFEVEALQAKLDEGAAGRQRGRQGTRLATRHASRQQGRHAGNKAARQEIRQAGRQATTQAGR